MRKSIVREKTSTIQCYLSLKKQKKFSPKELFSSGELISVITEAFLRATYFSFSGEEPGICLIINHIPAAHLRNAFLLKLGRNGCDRDSEFRRDFLNSANHKILPFVKIIHLRQGFLSKYFLLSTCQPNNTLSIISSYVKKYRRLRKNYLK